MRSLLDVNVLIALLDAAHMHHRRATDWLATELTSGWASTPITQNGCIRILSQPGYPSPLRAAEVAARLTDAVRDTSHAFWADSVSLLDGERIRWPHVLGARQVTDAYLLALAVRHEDRLVTLDRRIALAAVKGATSDHLAVV